jgi:signal peptidase I
MGKKLSRVVINILKFIGGFILAIVVLVGLLLAIDQVQHSFITLQSPAREKYHIKLISYWTVTLLYALVVVIIALLSRKYKRIKPVLYAFLVSFILTILAIALYSFSPFTTPYQVVGDSMLPTNHDGQYIVIQIPKNESEIQRGLVVVAEGKDRGKSVIKRVIAIGGDTVMIENGNVILNGKKLDESKYLKSDVITYGGSFMKEGKEYKVPEGSYVLMGDNRQFSSDSREVGFYSFESIDGKVTDVGL